MSEFAQRGLGEARWRYGDRFGARSTVPEPGGRDMKQRVRVSFGSEKSVALLADIADVAAHNPAAMCQPTYQLRWATSSCSG
jgi:hypothetical protein